MPPTPLGQLKRYLLFMVGGIVALDAVAIGLYYAFHIKMATPRTQLMFSGTWTIVSLAVVLVGLSKIRMTRVRYRQRPPAQP
jgi:Zn-dependent protease